MNLAPGDPRINVRVSVLLKRLQEFGWIDGRDLQIEYRWPAPDAASVRGGAAELVALCAEFILASGNSAVAALQQITSAVPVVFVNVIDPVGAGLLRAWRGRR